MGLYLEDAVSQYSWPTERIILFVPLALVIVGVTLFAMWQVLYSESKTNNKRDTIALKFNRIVDLMTVTGLIGVLSIWPAKVSVFYALFLVFAIFAINRLEQRFRMLDK